MLSMAEGTLAPGNLAKHRPLQGGVGTQVLWLDEHSLNGQELKESLPWGAEDFLLPGIPF